MKLTHEQTAYVLRVGRQFGGTIVWWEQGQMYVALTSATLNMAVLRRTANSVVQENIRIVSSYLLG